MFNRPTVNTFKNYFVRDFPYGTDIETSITDVDIRKAIQDSESFLNQALFGTQDSFTNGALLMAAHCLVMNIRMSSQGVSGKFEWAHSSKGVGSVSVAQAIPDDVLRNPVFSYYTQTNYGAKYLMIVYPKLCGAMAISAGRTQA